MPNLDRNIDLGNGSLEGRMHLHLLSASSSGKQQSFLFSSSFRETFLFSPFFHSHYFSSSYVCPSYLILPCADS